MVSLAVGRGGGALPLEGGCNDPFCQASRRSLVYQFTINVPLMSWSTPHFKFVEKLCIFSIIFAQSLRSQDAKFLNFHSQDPSFFKENLLPRPYFWKPAHTHQNTLV